MRFFYLSFVSILIACGEKSSEDTGVTDTSNTDTAEDSDTEETDTEDTNDTDVDDSGEEDTEEESSEEVLNHVLVDITVAGRIEGIDLNADGENDNAIWSLGFALNPLFATALETAERAPILQISELSGDSTFTDETVQLSLFTGSPNEDGSWSGGIGVDSDGQALVGTETQLIGGAHQTILLEGSLMIGELELEPTTPIHIYGDVNSENHTGLIGFGIGVDTLQTALEMTGNGNVAEVIVAVADLDTDGDGEVDAVSMVYSFSAEDCIISSIELDSNTN